MYPHVLVSKRLYNVNLGELHDGCRKLCGSVQTLQSVNSPSVCLPGKKTGVSYQISNCTLRIVGRAFEFISLRPASLKLI